MQKQNSQLYVHIIISNYVYTLTKLHKTIWQDINRTKKKKKELIVFFFSSKFLKSLKETKMIKTVSWLHKKYGDPH